MFERLRDALRAALEAATPPPDLRELVYGMREAVVEAKVAVRGMREALARSEQDLAAHRRELDDAERRGRLAAEIRDQETVEVAARFAAKHRERVAVLERKIAAQHDELALAERELADMEAQLRRAVQERGGAAADRSTERAWRDLQAAGGVRPGVDPQDEQLRFDMDRAAREAEAERQLAELKKKMRKE